MPRSDGHRNGMKYNKCFSAIIVGYAIDTPKQILTVYFELRKLQGVLLQQSFELENIAETYEFFRTCPVFTKDGKMDLSCFEGIRVYLKINSIRGSLRIESLEYDVMCYDSAQEEWVSNFCEASEGGGEYGKS